MINLLFYVYSDCHYFFLNLLHCFSTRVLLHWLLEELRGLVEPLLKELFARVAGK